MSVRCISWVWEKSRAEGLDRLVLLAIADNASDDGGNAWPSVETLSQKTKVSARTVQRAIRRLVDLGELEVDQAAGRNGVNLYRVVMTEPRGVSVSPPSDSHPDSLTPRQTVTPPDTVTPLEAPRGVTQTPPPRHADTQTVLEPSLSTSPNAVGGRRSRGTRLPDDWRPSAETGAWTLERLDRDLATHELEKFRNYWLAKAGKDATKLDWDRTWRNWVLKAAGPPTGSTRPSTTDQRVGDAMALAARLRGREQAAKETAHGHV